MEKSTQIYKAYREVYPREDALFFPSVDAPITTVLYFLTATCNFQPKTLIMTDPAQTARRHKKEDGGITPAVGQILMAYITVENTATKTPME